MKIIIDDQFYDEEDNIQVNINNNINKNDYKKFSNNNLGADNIQVETSDDFDVFLHVEDYDNVKHGDMQFDFDSEINNISNDEIYGPSQEEINDEFNNYYSKQTPHTKEPKHVGEEKISKHKKSMPKEKGIITVYSKLGDKNGIEIRGAKINLYELNGVTPKLCQSLLTDVEGKVVFNNLNDGCYRVVAIVDRRYFEKPRYVTWNEVTISNSVKAATVFVVNIIKNGARR